MRTFPSRNKHVPYLRVYCRRTERAFTEESATSSTTSTITCVECILATYDQYCEGHSGGPALTYWWKMGVAPCGYDNGWTATMSQTMSNRGTAVPSGFYGMMTNQTVTQAPAICLNTCDDLAMTPINVSGTATHVIFYAKNVLLDGTQPFTAGLWFSGTDFQHDRDLLFQSNIGGNFGFYRGVWVDPTPGGGIRVQFGDNLQAVSSNRVSFQTAESVVSVNTPSFLALYVNAVSAVSNNTYSFSFKLYINGILTSCPYVGGGGTGTIEFPTDSLTSGYVGARGVGFPGDLKNHVPHIIYDECFVHMGEITAAQVFRMWQLGTDT